MSAPPGGPPRDLFAIIPAAGAGARLGAAGRKAGILIEGLPLASWSIRAVAAAPGLAGGVVVVHPEDLDEARRIWIPRAALPENSASWSACAGGSTRAESVRRGLDLAPAGTHYVLVHDGARPLLAAEDLAAVVARARASGAAILGAATSDTLKRVEQGRIVATVDRTPLYHAQTPQVFRRELLERCYSRAGAHQYPTDEAGLLESAGIAVDLVEARLPNPKVTYPQDLMVVTALLAARLRQA